MTATIIAKLKIVLDDVKPNVLRRIEVPLTIRLDRLHLVLQAALGWTNSHLYEIRARDVGWGMPDPDFDDGPLDARKARLVDVLEDAGVKTLKYLYDFGDGWEHTIKIERITDADPGLVYPALIEAIGRCPPEDVGGPWGYSEFLDAFADLEHENHDEMRNGSARTTNQQLSTTEGWPPRLRRWPKNGPAKRQHGESNRDNHDPPRTDTYYYPFVYCTRVEDTAADEEVTLALFRVAGVGALDLDRGHVDHVGPHGQTERRL